MMPITDTVPASVYENYTQRQMQADLASGIMPITFTRRMRLLNLLSGVTLNKIPVPYVEPFKVLDIHHALNDGESAESIISQLDSTAMFQALAVGDITPLWAEGEGTVKLYKGFTEGWIPRFFEEPFSPINVMLAMRSKLLLEVVDELGHSYELLKSLGLGFIPDEDMEGWPPGGINDTIPDILDDPIDPPADADPGDPWYEPPEEGEPGYVPPVEGEPGYVPPGEGEPGYVPPVEGEPGYVPPVEGEPGYVPPGEGEPGYVPPANGEPTNGAPGDGAPGDGAPGDGAPGDGAPGDGAPGDGIGDGIGPGTVPPTLIFAPGPGDGSYTGFGDAYGPLGSGGRSPGAPAGGGGAVDCCIGSDGETVYLEADAVELACGETVAISIANLVEGCDVDNYCFEIIEGTGTLNLDEDGFLESYTAPDTNPGGVNNPTIALYCDDEIVDEIELIVQDWCVGDDGEPVSISYTTLQMAVDEYQAISLTNLKAAAPVSAFTFGLASGEGTLHFDVDGWLEGYTAPANNANCLKNPTIAVLCNDGPLDSITIAINAYASNGAYELKTILSEDDSCCAYTPSNCLPGVEPPLCGSTEYCGQKLYYACARHACDGTQYCITPPTKYICNYADPVGVWELKARAYCEVQTWYMCGVDGPLGVFDKRTQAMKDGGCCPAALI